MGEIIRVGMADMKTCKVPDIITTLGLGSCVGVVLFDSELKVAGMIHIMLPDSTKIVNNSNIYKFADTGITALYRELVTLGAKKEHLKAKIAGGAQMFSFQSTNDLLRIGDRNVEATKEQLALLGIPLLSEDTGESHGRTIEFHTESGELVVKSVGKTIKIL